MLIRLCVSAQPDEAMREKNALRFISDGVACNSHFFFISTDLLPQHHWQVCPCVLKLALSR